ncbi:4Fe-4S binding protein [Novipirellula artificiosorum]|uniref:Putative electron transport protein YccM n=1 Tax=Novipirellula artificiosorum TaxID=2528016 RepID=A0A5C6E4A5_9BACT|nr:4Fe-4S binding protein [Novipirellula artificiosorum]TWU42421.1 putative electron transport protein YccM [Novipirellula artificiosorum]
MVSARCSVGAIVSGWHRVRSGGQAFAAAPRSFSVLLIPFACLAFATMANAADVIPVPEFTDHEVPISMPAAGDHSGWEWLNVGLLVVALSLASYFALVNRSRRGLFLLAVASLAWFGFIRGGCICPIGATQNVTLAIFDGTYAIPWTVVAIFVLPLVYTLFFGRTFCSSVCPLGAIQEIVAVRPVRVPSWVDHTLGLVPYLYLGLAVLYAATGTAFIICRYDPFVSMFRLSGNVNMLVFGGALLVLGVFVGRPYCRYLCPYGAILGVLSKGSKWHAKIAPEKCITCHLCENSCPYGAISAPSSPPPKSERAAARRQLAQMIVLAPVLILLGLFVGRLLATPLSKLDPDVRLAERIILEDSGDVEDTTDASDAFRNTGQPKAELFASALSIQQRFKTLGMLIGGWFGFVIAVKLISLSLKRKRTDYQPDPSRCVSCARCYWYCPGEQVRLGIIGDVSELVELNVEKPTALETTP